MESPWPSYIAFLLLCLSLPRSLPGLSHFCGIHSSRSELCQSWVKHTNQGTSSLWFLLHGHCKEAVFAVTWKTTGKKGRKVVLCLWIHFLASALEPVTRAPQCLGNLFFLLGRPIMALTADKHREIGAGHQQENAAAPLALSPVTQSRPGAMYHPKQSTLQISFLKMVSLPLSAYIQNPALPYFWNPISWSLVIFQELYTHYLSESSWMLYQYWYYFSCFSFYRWCNWALEVETGFDPKLCLQISFELISIGLN